MEEAVLKGGEAFLRENSAPILLEYRLDAIEDCSPKNLNGVVEILSKHHYEIFSLTSGNSDVGLFDPKLSYENVIAVKKYSELTKFLFSSDLSN